MADLRFNVDVTTGAAQSKMSALGGFLMKTITGQVTKPFDEAGKIITKSVDIAGEHFLQSVLNPLRNYTNTLQSKQDVVTGMKQEFGLGAAYMPEQAMKSIMQQRMMIAGETEKGFSKMDAMAAPMLNKEMEKAQGKLIKDVDEWSGGIYLPVLNRVADGIEWIKGKWPFG